MLCAALTLSLAEGDQALTQRFTEDQLRKGNGLELNLEIEHLLVRGCTVFTTDGFIFSISAFQPLRSRIHHFFFALPLDYDSLVKPLTETTGCTGIFYPPETTHPTILSSKGLWQIPRAEETGRRQRDGVAGIRSPNRLLHAIDGALGQGDDLTAGAEAAWSRAERRRVVADMSARRPSAVRLLGSARQNRGAARQLPLWLVCQPVRSLMMWPIMVDDLARFRSSSVEGWRLQIKDNNFEGGEARFTIQLP